MTPTERAQEIRRAIIVDRSDQWFEAYLTAARDEWQREEEDEAFNMLELYGVTRDRAQTVANGIDVLVTRMKKAAHTPAPEAPASEDDKRPLHRALAIVTMYPNTRTLQRAVVHLGRWLDLAKARIKVYEEQDARTPHAEQTRRP
jgi:hypothetical protein